MLIMKVYLKLKVGEWHIPFGDNIDFVQINELRKGKEGERSDIEDVKLK